MKRLYAKNPQLTIFLMSLILAFFTILFASPTTSPFYPRMSLNPFYNDSSMFYVLGKSLTEGYTPYVDIFDHKGLYIYYINILAGLIGRTGVFIIQVLVMSVTYHFLFKTLCFMKVQKGVTVFALLLFFTLYVVSGQSTNDSDFALPCGAIMLYYGLKGIKTGEYKYFMFASMAAGVNAGIAIHLRMLDALVAFSFMVFYFVKAIKDKKFLIFLRDAAICIGMLVLASLPCIIHAYFGGFLKEMYMVTIVNNFSYIGTSGDRTDGQPELSYIIIGFTILLFGILLGIKIKKMPLDEILFITITYGIIAFVEIYIAFYLHYILMLYEYYAVVLALLLSYYESQKKEKPLIISAIVMAALSMIVHPVIYYSNYKEEKLTIKEIKENISLEERQNGHVMMFCMPSSTYLLTDTKINYGDFACQINHMMISERYSREGLTSFLASEDCHYLVSYLKYDDLVKELIEESNATYNLKPYMYASHVIIYEKA